MTRDEVLTILSLSQDAAVKEILVLAEKYDQLMGPPDPTTPSGMTPTDQKENHRGRKKKPGRKKGHSEIARKAPENITH
jgi:hypothetical protein